MPFFKDLNFENKPFRSERSVRAAGSPVAAAGAALAKGVLKIQAGRHERENLARAKGNDLEPRVAGELDVSPAPFEGAEGRTGLELQQELGIEPLPEVEALAAKAEKIRLRIAAGGSQQEGEDLLAVEFRKAIRQIGPENFESQQGNLRDAMATVIGGRADRQIAVGKGIDATGETPQLKAAQAMGQALGIHPQMMAGMDIKTLRGVVSVRQRAELEKKDHIANLNLENLEREVTGKRKTEQLVKSNDVLRRNAVSRLEPIKKKLDKLLESVPIGTVPDGQTLLVMGQVLSRAQFDLRRGIEADIDEQGDDGSASMGSAMDAKEREAAIAFGMTALAPYEEMLTNKTTGMQGVAARFNDTSVGGALATEYQLNDGLRKTLLIKKIMGEGPLGEGMITGAVAGFEGGRNFAAEIQEGLNRTGESRGVGGAAAAQQAIALTTGSTQAERVAIMDKAAGGNPVINRGTAIAPLAALYEPTASLEMKRAGYMSVYGPGNFDAAMKIAGTGSSDSAGKQLTYLNGTVSADNLAQVKKYGNEVGFDAVGGVTQYYVANLDNVSRQAKDTLGIQGLTVDYNRATEKFTVPEQDRPELSTSAPDATFSELGETALSNLSNIFSRVGDLVNTGARNESAEVLTESVASMRAFGKAVGNTPEETDVSVGAWLFKNALIDKRTAETYGLRFGKADLGVSGEGSTLLTGDDEAIVAPSAMTLQEVIDMNDKPARLKELKRRQKVLKDEGDRLREETEKAQGGQPIEG